MRSLSHLVSCAILLACGSCTDVRSTSPVEDDVTDGGSCRVGMEQVDGFCVDKWEAHLQGRSPYDVPVDGVAATAQGVVPQGYISGSVADAACRRAGKRLCTSDEWLRTCRGPANTTYPYGDVYEPGACNEGRASHPVVELFGDDVNWSSTQMNDSRLNQLPNSLDSTGSNPACVSAEGVFDLHGNLHEWVADADGTFRGGFYVDAEINGAGCLYRTTAHSLTYHDYSTGFRCCADPE
ncbi:MAG: SUMF1/EgtB/PvdO family nonheme iron enzyme [Rhodothermales bacterium]|nr:SUMF1/EgtB/PvdO family nonheme iron enzyme [Rhodothermales bacterium]